MKTVNIRDTLQQFYKINGPINVSPAVQREWPRILYYNSKKDSYQNQTHIMLLGNTQTQVYNNVFWPLFYN